MKKSCTIVPTVNLIPGVMKSSEDEEPETSTRSHDVEQGQGCGHGWGTGRGRRWGAGRGGSPASRRQWKNVTDLQKNQGISVAMPAFALEGIGPICPDAELEHVVDLFIAPDVVNMIGRQSNCWAHIELGFSNPPVLLKVYKDIKLADVYVYLAVIIIMGLVSCQMKMTTGALMQYWPRASCRASSLAIHSSRSSIVWWLPIPNLLRMRVIVLPKSVHFLTLYSKSFKLATIHNNNSPLMRTSASVVIATPTFHIAGKQRSPFLIT